jgi:hypothetical protein
VRVTVRGGVLDYRAFAKVLREAAALMPTDAAVLVLDFRDVTELRGPWGSHFAMVLRFSHRHAVPVRIVGMSGQPRALAHFFCPCRLLRDVISWAAGTSR